MGVDPVASVPATHAAKVETTVEAVAPVAVAVVQAGANNVAEPAKSQATVAPASASATTEGMTPSVLKENDAGAHDDSDERRPIYLQVLEALNSPIDALPDSFRAAIGKVAVVTFFNAIGLLVYVTFFRHHHIR